MKQESCVYEINKPSCHVRSHTLRLNRFEVKLLIWQRSLKIDQQITSWLGFADLAFLEVSTVQS